MTDICLSPNSPGALAAARAYRDGECILLCTGRPSWWCRHRPERRTRSHLGNALADIAVFDGKVEIV